MGCTPDGIDSITAVDPGPDETSPDITITYPLEGTTLNVLEEVTSIDIKFKVTDDIEIANIDVAVDGTSITTMDSFSDYRIANGNVTFDNVTNGDHTLTVTAVDTEGKTTTKTVNFSKKPPYTPKFDGEVFYMPFDGSYMDLVNLRVATEVGTPGFTSASFLGTSAYQGAADSYLQYEIPQMYGTNFSAAFWYKINATPDRSGILVAGVEGAGEDRTNGFRLFREPKDGQQVIKLNVGTGSTEVWNDGGLVDPAAGEWVHIAFTIDDNQTVLYINGMPVNTGNMGGNPIDWTGVKNMTIESGGETFGYWGHGDDESNMDELRLFDKTLSETDVQNMISESSVMLHMPMDGSYDDTVANREVTVVGSPGYAGEAKVGTDAYAGATGAYLTLPAAGLQTEEFSAAFWYKVDPSALRAGILTMSPEDTNNPDAQNIRTSGFRLFREGDASSQTIKLNVGTGADESWNNGTTIDATTGEWIHIAFTISTSESVLYINGNAVNTGTLTQPISWDGIDMISVMSGTPHFTEWGHLSDPSYMDDLRFYNKALSADEVAALAN